MQQILRFQPIYQERVWGGRALQAALARSLPAGGPIGESWEIVDRPEAQSILRGEELDGMTFRAALERHAMEIMGPRWSPERKFPILVKWLDCRERLSLQVHPPALVAPDLGGEPKTENWFIAQAASDASLTVGLRRGVTREQFERALREQTLESCVHRFPVAAGDSILVRSGQVHAIDGGNLILEIQQNSDTTYRVYDWGRVGLDGKPRALHVAESLKSIQWDDFEPQPLRATNEPIAVLADAPEFRIRRIRLEAGARFLLTSGEQPRIASVVDGLLHVALSGRGKVDAGLISRGDNVLLPFAAEVHLEAREATVLLLTENFC